MTPQDENFLSKTWMIFIRIIAVIVIPIVVWILRTTMNTDKNVAIIVEQMKSVETRISGLEVDSKDKERRYVEDLRKKFEEIPVIKK